MTRTSTDLHPVWTNTLRIQFAELQNLDAIKILPTENAYFLQTIVNNTNCLIKAFRLSNAGIRVYFRTNSSATLLENGI